MEKWILEVNNNADNFEAIQKEWLKHQVFIRMAKSMQEALELMNI